LCVGVSTEFCDGESSIVDKEDGAEVEKDAGICFGTEFWRLRVEAEVVLWKQGVCSCIVLHDDEAEASKTVMKKHDTVISTSSYRSVDSMILQERKEEGSSFV
jgi:hypothetical protein